MASSAKKSKPIPIVPPALRQAIALMFGPGRTITLAVFVLAVFAGGTVAVWRHVEKHVEGSADYRVGLEQIKITPQPEWVRCDVRAEAFRTASPPDRPLSILDDSLAERIRTAFMLHPWVASATVKKRAGARVDVDIGYRRPVCMVEVAVASTVELLPVDGEGVYLPGEDFSPKRKRTYPAWRALTGGQSSRSVTAGATDGSSTARRSPRPFARLAATEAVPHPGGRVPIANRKGKLGATRSGG